MFYEFDMLTANCFTIAKTSHRNFCQYAGIPLLIFNKLYALLLAINCLTADLKFLLNIPVVELQLQFSTQILI